MPAGVSGPGLAAGRREPGSATYWRKAEVRTIFEAFGPAPSSFESAPMASLLMKDDVCPAAEMPVMPQRRLSLNGARELETGLYGRAAAPVAPLPLHVEVQDA